MRATILTTALVALLLGCLRPSRPTEQPQPEGAKESTTRATKPIRERHEDAKPKPPTKEAKQPVKVEPKEAQPVKEPSLADLVRESEVIGGFNLFGEYDNNSVRADQLYKGKRVTVWGLVDTVQTDIRGRGAVFMAGSADNQYQHIVCYFDKSNASEPATLNKFDKVAIVGKCRGKLLTQVTLDDCRLVAADREFKTMMARLEAIKEGK